MFAVWFSEQHNDSPYHATTTIALVPSSKAFYPAEFKVQNLYFLAYRKASASVFNIFILNAIRGRWCQHFGFAWTAFVWQTLSVWNLMRLGAYCKIKGRRLDFKDYYRSTNPLAIFLGPFQWTNVWESPYLKIFFIATLWWNTWY